MKEQDYNLEEIIEQSFDFSDYSVEEKRELIEETSGMIMESSLLRALEEAGEELQEKFGDFIELDPDGDLMAMFIEKNIPNFPNIVIDEIRIFKEMGNE
ncbi:hypothetical protein [uncultured Lutibacter sp.]|uniref:hypothetical protein n=1 Tax=uncultured Lutibacter sp. TaxID=437739 RepID=UPI0026167E8D|nr:hypothetical protein [uncultured Lutibacter sp.]